MVKWFVSAEKITQDILNWSINFVEKKSDKLNNWPICPYAKQARLKDQVKIVEVKMQKIICLLL